MPKDKQKPVHALRPTDLTPERVMRQAMSDEDFSKIKHVVIFGFEENGAATVWATQMSVAMWALAVMAMQAQTTPQH